MTTAWDREILQDAAVPGDPGCVMSLSNWFRGLTTNLADAEQRFGALKGYHSGAWTGDAAEAFSGAMNDLPSQLGDVKSAYDHMAWLLWEYSNSLSDLQSRSHACAIKVNEAQEAYVRAIQVCQQSGGDPFNDPNVQAAHDTVKAASDSARAVYDEFQVTVATARGRINDSKATIGNNFGNAVGRWGGDVVGVAYDVVIKPIGDFFTKDFPAFIANPTWATFSKCLGDFTSVLSLVAIFVPGLAVVVLGLTAIRMAADVGAAAEGEESWVAVGWDGLALATEGVGLYAGSGAKALEDAAAQSAAGDALDEFQGNVEGALSDADFEDPEGVIGGSLEMGEHQVTLTGFAAFDDEATNGSLALLDHITITFSSPAAVQLHIIEHLTDAVGIGVDQADQGTGGHDPEHE
jgi:uncharacterized protein YukE